MKQRIAAALSAALETEVLVYGLENATGGSINEAAVVRTSQGSYFVKWNYRPIPDQFDREAEGLDALRTSGTPLRIPRPIAWEQGDSIDPGLLVLEYIERGRPVADFDERLGRGLALMHQATAPQFGFASDNYCGATTQPNPWTDDWITFYREHRLRHQLHLASKNRGVANPDFAAFDRMLLRLDDLLAGPPEPPALIHGDLWSGNLHVTLDGLPSILDPATYYGHREAELGMMSLFGGFSARVWDAYDEAYPLQLGWRDRLPLYELYHVINHYNLFGGGYGAQAFAIARRFG